MSSSTFVFKCCFILYLCLKETQFFFKFKYFFFEFTLKGVTKLYSTHYSCVVIILFNSSCKSAFCTDSFGKLAFLSFWAFCVFCLLCIKFDVSFLTLHNNYLHSTTCQVLCVFFSHLFDKKIRVIKIWL